MANGKNNIPPSWQAEVDAKAAKSKATTSSDVTSAYQLEEDKRRAREKVAFAKQELETYKASTSSLKTNIELREISLKLELAELELKEQEGKLTADGLKKGVKELKLKERSLKAQGKLASGTKELIKSTLGVSDAWRDGILGSILETIKEAKNLKEGMKDVKETVSESSKEAFKFGNVMHSIGAKVTQSTIGAILSLDTAMVSIAETTATFGKEFEHHLITAADAGRIYGVSFGELATSLNSLHGEYREFVDLTGTDQENLMLLVAKYAELGLNVGDSATSLNIFTKSLGMSGKEAKKTLKDIMKTAIGLKLQPGQMGAELKKSLDYLSMYGKRAAPIFERLAAAFKNTGIEVDSLLNLSKKFDKFQTASEFAGTFNMIMGQDLLNQYSIMSLLDPNKRVEAVASAFKRSGKRWEDLAIGEKLAMQENLGFTMPETAALLTKGLAGLKNAQAELAKAKGTTDADVDNKIVASVSIQEKVQLAVEAIAIHAKQIRGIVTGILTSIQKFEAWFKTADMKTIMKSILSLKAGALGATAGATLGGLAGLLFGPPGGFAAGSAMGAAIGAAIASFLGYLGAGTLFSSHVSPTQTGVTVANYTSSQAARTGQDAQILAGALAKAFKEQPINFEAYLGLPKEQLRLVLNALNKVEGHEIAQGVGVSEQTWTA